MFFPLIYWVVIPIILGWLIVRWIKHASPYVVSPQVAALYESRPLEKKWFRTLKSENGALEWLGDFEKQPEAVEAAYRGKEEAQRANRKASFQVYNDKAELLEQVDS